MKTSAAMHDLKKAIVREVRRLSPEEKASMRDSFLRQLGLKDEEAPLSAKAATQK